MQDDPIVLDDDNGMVNAGIDVDRFTGGFLNDDFKQPIERSASTGSEAHVVSEPIDNSNSCNIDFHVTYEQLASWEPDSMNFCPTVANWKGGAWKLLIKPYEDQYVKKYSLYLGLQKTPEMRLPYSIKVTYGFVFESKTERTYFGDEEKTGVYRFQDKYFDDSGYTDQGFPQLMDMDVIKRRALTDGPCYFRCHFYEVRTKDNYSSKKETGMVGLENLGATCYLNALLQMLYHLNAFRRAVYEIPNEGENIQNSTTLALQSVFHRLQTDVDQVNTRELTKAFGWNSLDSFMQQDVQEMMRVLMDKLEEKMKGSSVEDVIKRLFCGKVKSYIRCVNVKFESSREEEFYDIQLDVKGCDNIYESFRKYIEKEMLEGDNKYDAGEKYGKQDAQKGVIFTEFPPVLTIQLKRFDFDMTRMCFAKVHDKLEYPPELHLDEFLDQSNGPSNVSNDYLLHSVLVHSGDVNGGHYYAYIRPESQFWSSISEQKSLEEGPWFKFDDEVVTREHPAAALEKCYGRPKSTLVGNMASAYMLVYVRRNECEKIMKNIEELEIPTHLVEKLNKEDEQARMMEHKEFIKKNTCSIDFFTEGDIATFESFNSGQTFVDTKYTYGTSIDIMKSSCYGGIVLEIARKLQLKVYDIRVWNINDRDVCDEYRIGSNIWENYSVDDFTYQNRKESKKFYVEIVKDRNMPPEDCRYFDERMAVLESQELQWLERVRSEGGARGKSKVFPYDVAEGLGLGKDVKGTLKERISGVTSEVYHRLLEEFDQLHKNFCDFMSQVSKLDGDYSVSTLVFLRAYDPKETISTNTFRNLTTIATPFLPYIGAYYVHKAMSYKDLISSILDDFLSKLDTSICEYWQNAGFARIRKDGRIIRDDSDMSSIDGEILCIEPKTEHYSFDGFMNYQRFKKHFFITPATFFDAKIVRFIKYGTFYEDDDEDTFENLECQHTNFALEISTQSSLNTLYMEVSKLLGVHWSYVRLRICPQKYVVDLPNNAESKVLLASHEMQVLEKFHTHVISRGHNYLAFSILPIPWLDESTGKKLKGRLVDITLDGSLQAMNASKMQSSSPLRSRTSSDTHHIGRSDIKRSKTEELNEFIATSGDRIAEYEVRVTRDVMTSYSMFNPSSLCLFVQESDTIGDLNRRIREALDIPFIEEIDVEESEERISPNIVWVDDSHENGQEVVVFPQRNAANPSSYSHQPFSSEARNHRDNTILITISRNYRTRRICVSSDIIAAVVEKSWLEHVAPPEESVHAQLLTREEKLFMINKLNSGRSSSVIAVFNFQMYGAYGRPVEYAGNFGPFLTYITEDDTLDFFKERISFISNECGEENFEKYRLAFFRERGPPIMIDDSSDETANTETETDEIITQSSLWSQFVTAFPGWESATSRLENDLSFGRNLILMEGSIPVVGIQRYMQTEGRSYRRVPSAIKIA